MASTKITVENRTAIPIYALLTFAGAHVGGADIPAVPAPTPRPGAEGTGHHRDFPSRNIPCEYVWYDFWVLDPRQGLTHDGVAGGWSEDTRLQKNKPEAAPLGFSKAPKRTAIDLLNNEHR